MRATLSAAMVFVIGVVSVMADDPKTNTGRRKDFDTELKAFVGVWDICHAQPAGAAKEAKKLHFREDMTYAALDKDGKEMWAGTFDLDPTATPKIWDHRSNKSKKTGGDVLGIYELDGDRLKVGCVVGVWKDDKQCTGREWMGKPRPTEYRLPNADVVLELRRAKPDERP